MRLSILNSYIAFIFLGFISILPFIYIQNIFNPYEFPKFILLATVSLIAGNMLLVLNLFKKKISMKLSNLDIAVLLFITVLLFADVFGFSFLDSLLGNSYRLQGFITYLSLGYLYLIARFCSFRIDKGFFAKLLSLQLLGLSLFLISQFLINTSDHYEISLFQNRFHGSFGNPNFAGGYLAMVFSYILFWNESNSFIYKVKPLILLLGGIGIVLTDSRSAILAVIFIVAVYFIVLLKFLARYKTLILLLLTISLGSVFFLGKEYSLIEKRSSIWENRSIIWREGIDLVVKKPILGYGQENVSRVFPENLHFNVDNMHNIFLEHAVAAGGIGLLSFLTLVSLALRSINNSGRFLVITFLIIGFFNPLSISQLVLFWGVIGIGQNE